MLMRGYLELLLSGREQLIHIFDCNEPTTVQFQRAELDHVVHRARTDSEHFCRLLLIHLRWPRMAVRIEFDRSKSEAYFAFLIDVVGG